MSNHEPKEILDYTLLFWGIGLIIHLITYLKYKKNSIKGLHKEDIFD